MVLRLGSSTTPSADFRAAVKVGLPAFSRCHFRASHTEQISLELLPKKSTPFSARARVDAALDLAERIALMRNIWFVIPMYPQTTIWKIAR